MPLDLLDDLDKFKSWSPAQIQSILDKISSTEFEKLTTGEYSTKRLRQRLNSLHEVVDEVPLLNLPIATSRRTIINAIKGMLQIRLDSLLRLSIPTSKSRILAKAHAKSGIREVSLGEPSVRATMKMNLSSDEMLAITSKESLVHKSVKGILERGSYSQKF
jgi:hypothetical protein